MRSQVLRQGLRQGLRQVSPQVLRRDLRRLVTWALLFIAVAPVYAAPYTPLPGDASLEAQLLTLTNQARLDNGVGTLERDEGLAQAARHHAEEMARLGYFSHTSPTPENATVSQRVARSGSFIGTLGENLALVGETNTAQTTTTGWLESPGHRANLLNPEFTHVGFGVARYPDGRVAVAQVLGYQPAPLQNAQIVSVLQKVPMLEATVSLSSPGEVALFYGDQSSPPEILAAGTQTLNVPLQNPPTLPLAVQLGLRSSGAQGSFILQDDGWLNADGFARSGEVSGEYGQLLGVTFLEKLERVLVLQLTFARTPPEGLSAWQGNSLVPLMVAGTRASVNLTGLSDTEPLYVGEAQTDGRYAAAYSFQPNFAGVPSVAPVTGSN